MGARESTYFVLTLKGNDELAKRTYRLDIKLRNILLLIQKGTPTIESILERSIFPREEVVEKLRALLKEQFVSLNAGSAPAESTAAPSMRPPTVDIPLARDTVTPGARTSTPAFFTLDPGVSCSQARFVLCDFCLDLFGMDAPARTDAINAATDLAALQQVLDDITVEMKKHFKDQLPILADRVREINDSAA